MTDIDQLNAGTTTVNEVRARLNFPPISVTPMIYNREFSAKAVEAFNATGLPHVFNADRTSAGTTIRLYDVIGEGNCTTANFMDALDMAEGGPVTLRLSSVGGSVFTGWEVHNALKNYPGETTCYVDGIAASIASVIALGADKVLTAPTSLWMAHSSMVGVLGNAVELRDHAATLDKIDQLLMQVYATKTGKSVEAWATMMANETWFSSSEAIDIGLADGLSEPAPKTQASNNSAEATKLALQKALRVRRAMAKLTVI